MMEPRSSGPGSESSLSSSVKNPRFGLSATALKWIAVLCMTLDHIAWAWVPLNTPAGQVLHALGRITAPIMCFLVAEGFHYTRSRRKYALRLGIFALLSHFPFLYFETGQVFYPVIVTSVIYTLLLGLLALWAWTEIKPIPLRVLSLILFMLLAAPGDWSYFGVLMVMVFGVFRGNFRRQAIGFCCVVAAVLAQFVFLPLTWGGQPTWIYGMMAGMLLALPLLWLYNGQRGGGSRSSLQFLNKWAFYLYYPLHLLILGVIRWVLL